ncbi:MAG: phage portal protein [Deltaproteobacteria bacterium]|nr:phage portal protein [Deltaproteobacteria bacterium]
MGWLGKIFGRSKRAADSWGPEPEDVVGDNNRDRWRPRTLGPNAIDWDFELTRSRIRNLIETNPHAASATQGIVGALIGTGVTPRSMDAGEWLSTKLGQTFGRWADAPCDVQGQHNFWSLQAQVGSGFVVIESFLQRVPARSSDGLEVPLMLRPIESEQLDHTKNGSTSSGGRIVNGVELDGRGRRVAYHFFREHPGERVVGRASTLETVRIPHEDIAHFFHAWRIGATRGGFWLKPVVTKLRDLDDLDDAELVKRKIESCFTIVVNSDVPHADRAKVGPVLTDARGRKLEQIEPGLMVYGRGATSIQAVQPSVSGNAEGWRKGVMHTLSSGMRVPYAIMTGDLSETNYASGRMGQQQFNRCMSMLQWHSIVPGMARIMDWWMDAALVAGKLRKKGMRVGWTPPKMESPNPVEDIRAALMRVRAGASTLGSEIAAMGDDPGAVWSERAAELAEHKKLGLVFDTDPSKTMAAGGQGAVAYVDPGAVDAPADKTTDGKDDPLKS